MTGHGLSPICPYSTRRCRQTQWPGEALTEQTWREVVGSRLRVLAWDQVAADVRPFLEREEDAALLNMETALELLVG